MKQVKPTLEGRAETLMAKYRNPGVSTKIATAKLALSGSFHGAIGAVAGVGLYLGARAYGTVLDFANSAQKFANNPLGSLSSPGIVAPVNAAASNAEQYATIGISAAVLATAIGVGYGIFRGWASYQAERNQKIGEKRAEIVMETLVELLKGTDSLKKRLDNNSIQGEPDYQQIAPPRQ